MRDEWRNTTMRQEGPSFTGGLITGFLFVMVCFLVGCAISSLLALIGF